MRLEDLGRGTRGRKDAGTRGLGDSGHANVGSRGSALEKLNLLFFQLASGRNSINPAV